MIDIINTVYLKSLDKTISSAPMIYVEKHDELLVAVQKFLTIIHRCLNDETITAKTIYESSTGHKLSIRPVDDVKLIVFLEAKAKDSFVEWLPDKLPYKQELKEFSTLTIKDLFKYLKDKTYLVVRDNQSQRNKKSIHIGDKTTKFYCIHSDNLEKYVKHLGEKHTL